MTQLPRSRVLITGAGGVLGKALVGFSQLSARHEVIPVEGRSQVDLECPRETTALFRFVRPQKVIHLAAAVHGVGGNLRFPGDVFRRNILINTNVVEACRQFKIEKIVAMGSAAIYSDSVKQPFAEAECMMGEPHSSEYAYATAKRALLVQLKSYRSQFALDYAYAIATNLYGPHDRFDSDHGHVVPSLISKFYKAYQERSEVSVWGNGTPTRDFLFSADAARAIMFLLDHGIGEYNVASGTVHRISDLVDVLSRRFPGVKVKWDATKPLGQLTRSYDIGRLTALGFSSQVDLMTGINTTVDWYIQNQQQPNPTSESHTQ